MAKSRSKSNSLLGTVIPAAIILFSILAIVFFILPQITIDKTLITAQVNYNGFQLAFGYEILSQKHDGQFYFFLPFIFAILTAAAAAVTGFTKVLKGNEKIVYLVIAVLGLISVVLYIIYLATAGGDDYFKTLVDDSDYSGWAAGIFLGLVAHILIVAGGALGFVTAKK